MHVFVGCNTITFERLDAGNSFLHIQGIHVKFVYEGYRVKIKVTEAKKSKIIFLQCKTLIDHNSASIRHRAMRFVCSTGILAMTDRMV